MNAELSPEAKTALINAGSSRMGARVLQPSTCTPAAFVELHEAGLIGANDGLTRKGSITRERLVRAALDAAFG